MTCLHSITREWVKKGTLMLGKPIQTQLRILQSGPIQEIVSTSQREFVLISPKKVSVIKQEAPELDSSYFWPQCLHGFLLQVEIWLSYRTIVNIHLVEHTERTLIPCY